MSVSRRVIHHGLYFAVLGPLIGVLFLVLYIFFAKEPLVLWVIIHPIFLLLSITTGAIPALLTGVMVACLPEKIGSQKRYRCLAGGIGGVVITEIYCAVIVHIKGMASSELFENILSGDSLVVRIIPALLAGVVMSRIITRLPGLDISCPETDSLSVTGSFKPSGLFPPALQK
ncbi:hypothetical protein SND59_19145 [Escherichia coli]|nr:hypothetical protein [Escherichia coli]EJA3213419.1 hypothetical protein [Escherichia coli]MDZ8591351.1 hypothetical protein [Escherichia coli]MEA0137408.1 hypothetical protein [Escherichia coli]